MPSCGRVGSPSLSPCRARARSRAHARTDAHTHFYTAQMRRLEFLGRCLVRGAMRPWFDSDFYLSLSRPRLHAQSPGGGAGGRAGLGRAGIVS